MIEPGEKDAWEWRFGPGHGPGLAPLLADWDRLEDRPGAAVLKSNFLRQVIRVPAADGLPALIVKRYRLRRRSEQFKYLVMPSRAQREWDALGRLAAGGVRVPPRLAFGEERHGLWLERAGLIATCVEDTLPLPEWLAGVTDPGARAERVAALGEEIARMHAAGVDHTDLHAGNILCGLGPDTAPIWIIDLHATYLGASLPEFQRRRNLGKLLHSIRDVLSPREKRAFLDGYRRHPQLPPFAAPDEVVLAELDDVARAFETVRLRSRSRRCWKNSTEFVKERRGGWTIHRRREIEPASLAPFLEAQVAFDEVFKDRSDQKVGTAVLETSGGTLRVVVKTREHRGLIRRLGHALSRGPLERAWGAARALDVRGIPNPRALALAVEHDALGLPIRSVLVTEWVAAKPLHTDLLDRYWPYRPAGREEIPGRIARLAREVLRLHDTGIYHRDLNPMNILVTGEGDAEEFLLVDLDSIYLGRQLSDRRRRKNLVQLALTPEGHLTPRDRLRFLRDYDAGSDRYYRRDWIDALGAELRQEIIKIIARFSRQELKLGTDAVGDPRFRVGSTTERNPS